MFLFNCAAALQNNIKPIIRGPTAPFENVDLFKQNVLFKDVQPSFLREAELKHGRLAMLASIILPLTEQYTSNLGINFFQDHPELIEVGVSLMFTSEFLSMIRGWENPLVKPFALKEDYQPGDLGLGTDVPGYSMGVDMDKELNNGRLAMIGILGMMVQELVTHQQLFT
jgi:light-harvesting complex I chlorophyll a/b binding protein 1